MSQRSWVRYPVWPHTFVSPSTDSREAVVSNWKKYVHKVLVNRLKGPSLPRKSVVRLTDHPDMTLDVYRGCKTRTQHNDPLLHVLLNIVTGILDTPSIMAHYSVPHIGQLVQNLYWSTHATILARLCSHISLLVQSDERTTSK